MTNRRFDSIGGILNRIPASPDADNSPQPKPAPKLRSVNGETDNPAGPPVVAVRQPQPRTRASAKSDGGVRRIAFRLEPALHEALTARAASDKTSQGQVVLNCIEAAHRDDALSNLVAAERDAPQTDSLFPRLRSRNAAQATVPVEIRLHAQAAAILQQLVHQTAAESRTQLIIAALRHSLT